VIKRATLLSDGPWVESKCLPFEITHYARLGMEDKIETSPQSTVHSAGYQTDEALPVESPNLSALPLPEATPIPAHTDLKSIAQGAEYQMIMQVLYQTRFNKSKAAQLLGVDRKTLYNKLKMYNIK
jgi:two-component system, NtrC family, response regulator HydG